MVQVIENQAQIQGEIVAISPHPSLPGYSLVTLRLTACQTLPGKVNLLNQPLGTPLQLTVRSALLGQASQGEFLHCRAKRTPDGAMCEKEPEPGNFAIERRP